MFKNKSNKNIFSLKVCAIPGKRMQKNLSKTKCLKISKSKKKFNTLLIG